MNLVFAACGLGCLYSVLIALLDVATTIKERHWSPPSWKYAPVICALVLGVTPLLWWFVGVKQTIPDGKHQTVMTVKLSKTSEIFLKAQVKTYTDADYELESGNLGAVDTERTVATYNQVVLLERLYLGNGDSIAFDDDEIHIGDNFLEDKDGNTFTVILERISPESFGVTTKQQLAASKSVSKFCVFIALCAAFEVLQYIVAQTKKT